MNKIFISDLDGTLLNNDAEITKSSLTQLNEMIQNGLNFTIATARSIHSIKQILNGLNLKLPIIEFNGAYITDFTTSNHIRINDIEDFILYDIEKDLNKFGLEYLVSSFDGNKNNLYYSIIENNGIKWYVNNRKKNNDSRLVSIDNYKKILDEDIVCFTIIDKKHKLEEYKNHIENKDYIDKLELHLNENMYSPGWYWLTIHDYKATKDRAIDYILQRYGYDKSDLVVFGDNINDIKMFKYAGYSVAVENAVKHLKKIADEVIGQNIDDSVVKFIKESFK